MPLIRFYHFNIIAGNGICCGASQAFEKLGGQGSFSVCIFPAPRPALDFQEFAQVRFFDVVDVDEKFGIFKADQKAQAVFFYFCFMNRFEVFAVKAQALACRGEITGA